MITHSSMFIMGKVVSLHHLLLFRLHPDFCHIPPQQQPLSHFPQPPPHPLPLGLGVLEVFRQQLSAPLQPVGHSVPLRYSQSTAERRRNKRRPRFFCPPWISTAE